MTINSTLYFPPIRPQFTTQFMHTFGRVLSEVTSDTTDCICMPVYNVNGVSTLS